MIRFYKTTQNSWSSGKLSNLGKAFENEGKLQYQDFIKRYLPIEESALHVFFTHHRPSEGEYLIRLGNLAGSKQTGCFILTNLRLIQKDGKDNKFKEIELADIDTYKINAVKKTMQIEIKSGEKIVFEKLSMFPEDKFLSETIKLSSNSYDKNDLNPKS